MSEGAIVYEPISASDDLPAGWTDHQDAATYRLERREDESLFGFVVGPHSWKKFLHPAKATAWKGRVDNGVMVEESRDEPPRYAFVGVRPCELAAIAIQDRVLDGDFPDPVYQARRNRSLLVAVNCNEPGGTCFCTSMDTGPQARDGYDLVLTEMVAKDSHRFLLEAGSAIGEEIVEELSANGAAVSSQDLELQADLMSRSAAAMGRQMDTTDIHDLLLDNLEHPQWEDVAARCLACTNCTMACPTCFCTDIDDTLSLDGSTAERTQTWASCFSLDFSYIHGGPVRPEPAARYRQWMTHKLATWIDQFGSSGCVGCGRCITWCPVGIDITAEVAAIRAHDQRKANV